MLSAPESPHKARAVGCISEVSLSLSLIDTQFLKFHTVLNR